MSEPKLFPCGGRNQPPCPPEPCAVIGGVALYTAAQVAAHGQAAYDAALASTTVPVEGVTDGPAPEDL